MRIGLDLDGTITAAPEFFAWLSQQDVEIHVVTSRNPSERDSTERYLANLGLRYEALVFTYQKGAYCRRFGLAVFFEDLDHFVADIPVTTLALKVRNAVNFDVPNQTWRNQHEVYE